MAHCPRVLLLLLCSVLVASCTASSAGGSSTGGTGATATATFTIYTDMRCTLLAEAKTDSNRVTIDTCTALSKANVMATGSMMISCAPAATYSEWTSSTTCAGTSTSTGSTTVFDKDTCIPITRTGVTELTAFVKIDCTGGEGAAEISKPTATLSLLAALSAAILAMAF